MSQIISVSGNLAASSASMGTKTENEVTFYRDSLKFFKAANIIIESKEKEMVCVVGFLASHSLEVALKAFLFKKGQTKIKDIGHDLIKAWEKAHNLGLALEGNPRNETHWCCMLNKNHSTYRFRYSKSNTLVSIPKFNSIISELEKVLDLVGKELRMDREGNFMDK